ncbi:MAG: hypothetical protein J6R35_04920 [Clostridia bacterium]|nr:hypothetical protein [Clostridia bacterium]
MIGKFRYDKTPKVSRVTYNVTSFEGFDAETPANALNPRYCSYGYNIYIDNGKIKRIFGVGDPFYPMGSRDALLPSLASHAEQIQKIAYFRRSNPDDDMMLVLGAAGHVFYCNLIDPPNAFTKIDNIQNEGAYPEFINYYLDGKDCMLIFWSGGLTVFDGTSATTYDKTPALSSACIHYDRVFGVDAVDQHTLHFSAQLMPNDFTPEGGGGSISLMDEGGKIQKIISMGGYLYLFREFSVSRLTAYANPEDYVLTGLFKTHELIVPDSIAVNNDSVTFFAGNSLYVFNGSSLRRVHSGLTALIESTAYASSCFFNGKYYCSCKLKTEGEQVGDEATMGIKRNNGVIVIDTLTDAEGVFRGADIIGFLPILSSKINEIFVVYGNSRVYRAGKITDDGKIYGKTLPKYWRSPRVNFNDPARVKHLRRVYIKTNTDLTVTVYQDDTESSKRAYGSMRSSYAIPFNTIGDDFCISFAGESEDFAIDSMQLVFDFNRRYYT